MTAFAIDPVHTDILFSAKHMMVTTVRGTFKDVEGMIDLDETSPTDSEAEIRVKVASLDTKFGARDNHLRSADFFDVERFPEIIVRSTGIRHRRGNAYKVTADVTIRDVTRSVDLDVEFLGFYPAMDGSRRAGFSASARVNRKDWGLDWNVALETGGWLVGDEVRLEVDVAVQERVAVAA
jgi:polyisoprenoid-binding protein YceI